LASQVFVVQTQDAYGNVTNVSSKETNGEAFKNFYFYGSDYGSFALNSEGTFNIKTYPLAIGENTFSFYYKDRMPGIAQLRVSDQSIKETGEGIIDLYKNITIEGEDANEIVFASMPQNIKAGEDSSIVTIEARKLDGMPAI